MHRIVVALLGVALLAGTALTQVAPGWTATTSTLCPGGQLVGGLDVLPDGTLLFFDGNALVRSSSAGQSNVFVPPSRVFGSFVRLLPGNQAVLLGESSTGTIWEISIGMLPYFRTLATIPNNYDCAIGPNGEILVSALDSVTPPRNAVYLVDRGTGVPDKLIEVVGNSGPIAVTPSGDILLGTLSQIWPAPPGSAALLRFPLARWRGAIGPTHLTERDAVVEAPLLGNIAHLAVDSTGRAYFSDHVGRTVWTVTPHGVEAVYTLPRPAAPGYLTFTDVRGPAWFRPYQPAGGGTLLCTSTDWATFNDLVAISALRPTLDSGFTGPIPPQTPVNLTHQGGPPNGLGVLFFALQDVTPEAVLPGFGFPLFMGIDPLSIMIGLPLPLDASGQGALRLFWPGGASGRLWAQTFDLDGLALIGSSNPLQIQL